jgi:hypothetical protein
MMISSADGLNRYSGLPKDYADAIPVTTIKITT